MYRKGGFMRIALDARLKYYRQGGTTNYIRNISGRLPGDLHVLHHFRDPITWGRRVNVFTPCHHRLERWALSLELLPRRFDLLHSPDVIPPQRGARKHVISVMDLGFLHYPQFLTEESRRYYNDQIAWAVAHADHILTISETTARDLREMLGVPPEKITVNLLGVEPAFRPQRGDVIAEMRERFGLPASYLLFVGVFEPRKNIPNLLRAYRLLPGRTPPLVLAGRRGWLYEESFALIESLDLRDRVIVLEDVPQGDLPTLYSGAVLHLLPSFYEGFGLPALEAMACGTPTIVSDRGALPEVVGDVGALIDPDDPEHIARAIRDLLKDSGRRLEMTALGLAHAASFTWKRTAEVVYDVYQKVLEDL